MGVIFSRWGWVGVIFFLVGGVVVTCFWVGVCRCDIFLGCRGWVRHSSG